jgi:hypothetical protein
MLAAYWITWRHFFHSINSDALAQVQKFSFESRALSACTDILRFPEWVTIWTRHDFRPLMLNHTEIISDVIRKAGNVIGL